ncbi:putative GPI-anchored protein [Trifolium repens]|nr:putative GPI-anchored protein [Trifolium repens]
MSSFKLGLYLLLFVFSLNLHTSPVTSACGGEKETDLLHDINTYRKVLNLPVLEKANKPSCLANKIANNLEDKQCLDFHNYYPSPGSNPKIPNFQKSVEKCKININTTKDGVIMPVCVPKLDQDNLFSNYTKYSHFTKYLNNSKYTIAGVGSEDDWMVLIISTNTSSGDFSYASSLLVGSWKGHWLMMMATFFSVIVFLFN